MTNMVTFLGMRSDDVSCAVDARHARVADRIACQIVKKRTFFWGKTEAVCDGRGYLGSETRKNTGIFAPIQVVVPAHRLVSRCNYLEKWAGWDMVQKQRRFRVTLRAWLCVQYAMQCIVCNEPGGDLHRNCKVMTAKMAATLLEFVTVF